MERYVGMDVSLEETSICVIDDDGEIMSEGTVISEPEAIGSGLRKAWPGDPRRDASKRLIARTECRILAKPGRSDTQPNTPVVPPTPDFQRMPLLRDACQCQFTCSI